MNTKVLHEDKTEKTCCAKNFSNRDGTLYIVSPFESKLEGRGTRNLFFASRLSQYMSVCFLTTDFSHQKKVKHDKAELCSNDKTVKTKIFSCPIYKNNISVKRVISHWVISLKFFWYLFWRANFKDLVLVSSIPPEMVFFMFMLKSRRTKIILDVRDIWPDAFPSKKKYLKTIFGLYCNILYLCLNKADIIFYIAPTFEKWLRRHNVCFKKLAYVPLGFDSERWDRVYLPQKKIDCNKDVIRFVYIGSLEEQFPLESFLDAIKNLDNIVFDIVGDGKKIESYKKIASRNVIFHGNLIPSEAAKIVASCHFGVLPIKEAAMMPNKLFDYLGAGLAVFAVGMSDASHFVKSNNVGIATDFDAKQIRMAIGKISNDELLNYMSNCSAIRSFYSKDFVYSQALRIILNQ
jgi:glycosyltransferase involved in cell wall biosynthesis